MRQQALANGIYKSGKYEFVFSSVSFDKRNTVLKNCFKNTFIKGNFEENWKDIYENGSDFITWYHQDWVDHIKGNNKDNHFDNWLKYLNSRYNY